MFNSLLKRSTIVTVVINQGGNQITNYEQAIYIGVFEYAKEPTAFNAIRSRAQGYDLIKSFPNVTRQTITQTI